MGRTTGKLFKRGGNRDYSRYKARLEVLFHGKLQNSNGSAMLRLSTELGIPQSTLYRWRDTSKRDPEWRPWKTNKRNQHRIFTDAEETSMCDFICRNFLEPGILFTNQDFKRIALDAWLEKYRDSDNDCRFEASDGFVTKFKKRHGFTSRRAHHKRRSTTDQQYVEQFMSTMKEILATKDPERIINADETFWRTIPGDMRTWGKRGSQNIQFHAAGGDKDGVTVVAAISAARTKLPLQIIATGRTDRCLSQLGDTAHHLKARSKKRWSTGETFRTFLMSLRERFPDDDPVWLVLDCYSAHRDKETLTLADSLGIKLIFIPAGFTDELQPLDRSVFGVLKGYLRRMWRERFIDNPETKFNKALAVELLIPAWEKISSDLIAQSWSIYAEDGI